MGNSTVITHDTLWGGTGIYQTVGGAANSSIYSIYCFRFLCLWFAAAPSHWKRSISHKYEILFTLSPRFPGTFISRLPGGLNMAVEQNKVLPCYTCQAEFRVRGNLFPWIIPMETHLCFSKSQVIDKNPCFGKGKTGIISCYLNTSQHHDCFFCFFRIICINLLSVGRPQFSSLDSVSQCFVWNMLNPSMAE